MIIEAYYIDPISNNKYDNVFLSTKYLLCLSEEESNYQSIKDLSESIWPINLLDRIGQINKNVKVQDIYKPLIDLFYISNKKHLCIDPRFTLALCDSYIVQELLNEKLFN